MKGISSVARTLLVLALFERRLVDHANLAQRFLLFAANCAPLNIWRTLVGLFTTTIEVFCGGKRQKDSELSENILNGKI
jgi:hypothetical protein